MAADLRVAALEREIERIREENMALKRASISRGSSVSSMGAGADAAAIDVPPAGPEESAKDLDELDLIPLVGGWMGTRPLDGN